MYKKNPIYMSDRDEVKAIRLWSDWNAVLKKWAEYKVKSVRFYVVYDINCKHFVSPSNEDIYLTKNKFACLFIELAVITNY